MTTHTVAAICDYGPGMTTAQADGELREKLQKAVDYYLAVGVYGERFTAADVGEARFTSRRGAWLSKNGLRSRRIEAEVTFS